MNLRAAIVFLAFAVPAFAQHGGAHAGTFGGRGFSGHAGFSSQPAFSRPSFSHSPGFARPAPPARYGAFPGYRTYRQPGQRSPYNGNRFAAGRPFYVPRDVAVSRGFDRDRGMNPDRDRFDRRRRQFQNWVVNTYPYGPAYPYLIDPNAYNLGLYDWDDSDDSAPGNNEPEQAPGSYEPGSYASDQNGTTQLYAPYPNQGYDAPVAQARAAAPAISGMPLTVIFNNGRAPIKVRNYLMTSRVLTDLDSQHYEQIPLDQVDLASTKRFNTFAGVDFQVPGPSRN